MKNLFTEKFKKGNQFNEIEVAAYYWLNELGYRCYHVGWVGRHS